MTSSGYNADTTEQLRASDESISQRSDLAVQTRRPIGWRMERSTNGREAGIIDASS